jgi:hypothetical protein
MMYHSVKSMQHKGTLFDKVEVESEVNDLELHREMTRHRFQQDYYQEKQYVHRMDHMLNKNNNMIE